MILRHRDLVAEMFGWLLRRSVDASRTARAQTHTHTYPHAFKRINVYVIRTVSVLTRVPSGTRRRNGAHLLSLPDSLAAWRPTGYAAVSSPRPHPSPASPPHHSLPC